ncbi:HEPN domain-containing protein [Hydrogenophaga sp. IBVHS1]|uniref:HEPN domain-containing protein n=1 Tax=unclassified Hydrogenophaga TaxID=2610897 RepID=UPI001179EB17|nr:MAE_28990/MAE_18760 family HEPN-like nuclease [Hydrogenophaga sp. IBVHS1]
MIENEFQDFRKRLRQAKSLFHLNEWVRNRTISLPSDEALGIAIFERNEYSRYFDYSGALTSLYATYEAYVFAIVTAWLRIIGASNYTVLSEKDLIELRESYRRHTGFCIQHLSQKRFENIGLENLLISALKSNRGRKNQILVPEVFYSNLNNLRLNDLHGLFSDVKLLDASNFLNSRPYLQDFLEGTGNTLDSYLSGFVQRRNDVAHGNGGGELLGLSSLVEIADFLELLGQALRDFLLSNLLRSQKCVPIGTFQKRYKTKRVLILVSNGEYLSNSDRIIIQSDREILVSQIESLEAESSILGATTPGNLDPMGVQIKHIPPASGKVFRILSPMQSFL